MKYLQDLPPFHHALSEATRALQLAEFPILHGLDMIRQTRDWHA